MFNINNLPEYAKDMEFIVATIVDGEFWFYGGYDSIDKAYDVADEIDGVIIH